MMSTNRGVNPRWFAEQQQMCKWRRLKISPLMFPKLKNRKHIMTTLVEKTHIRQLLKRQTEQLQQLRSNAINKDDELLSGFRFGWQLANNELRCHRPLTRDKVEEFKAQCPGLLQTEKDLVYIGSEYGMLYRFDA